MSSTDTGRVQGGSELGGDTLIGGNGMTPSEVLHKILEGIQSHFHCAVCVECERDVRHGADLIFVKILLSERQEKPYHGVMAITDSLWLSETGSDIVETSIRSLVHQLDHSIKHGWDKTDVKHAWAVIRRELEKNE